MEWAEKKIRILIRHFFVGKTKCVYCGKKITLHFRIKKPIGESTITKNLFLEDEFRNTAWCCERCWKGS